MCPPVRLIAFYLPQFHPIPENDAWWGKGFTEWTNVARARPLYPGHYQPRIPADLGFYDLRVPETRAAQAEMARAYGIEGFCYWHYWFAGKRLLERPFSEVLQSGEPDFPFCLAWANQTWTGIWHGSPERILIQQTYPGIKDYTSHFYALLDAFGDDRYITIEGKPVFLVQCASELPEPKRFTDCWRELAIKSGLKGLYLIGVVDPSWVPWVPGEHGFDGMVLDNPTVAFRRLRLFSRRRPSKILRELGRRLFSIPFIYSYREAAKWALLPLTTDFDQYPCVISGWDNTPRSDVRGVVLQNSTPELFGLHLRQAIEQVVYREPDKRIVFVKSWNEWAEGNYLEPDQRFGRAYLEACRAATT